MTTSDTNLGRYLSLLRNDENVSDYLRKHGNPISGVYYRDVESGRKTVSLEMAEKLCEALGAQRSVFYYHLLRDILPVDVAKSLLRLVSEDETFSSTTAREAAIHREAFARAMAEETHVMSDEAVNKLSLNPNLMPVLHFLYSTEFSTAEQLTSILELNGVTETPEYVARLFDSLDLVVVEGELGTKHNWGVRRKATHCRVPPTQVGKNFKRAFARREVEKTLGQLDQRVMQEDWSNIGAFVDTSIVALSPETVSSVRARILAVLAEMRAGEKSISSGHAMPYFCGIFWGSRSEYSLTNLPPSQGSSAASSDPKVSSPSSAHPRAAHHSEASTSKSLVS